MVRVRSLPPDPLIPVCLDVNVNHRVRNVSYNWLLKEGPIILLYFLHLSPSEAARLMPQRLQKSGFSKERSHNRRLTIMDHG